MTEPVDAVEGPVVVLVGGAPGSGKTRLATRLAPAMGLPLIAKDGIKELLYDTLGLPDAETSMRYGKASTALLFFVAARLLDAGTGIVLESNFQQPYSDQELRTLVARRRAVFVYCDAPADMIVQRYRARAERGERHPGHHDKAAEPRLIDGLARGAYEPPHLGVPVIRVDTTSDYAPPFEQIVDLAREYLSQ